MDLVPCSSSPALPPGFSTRSLEEPGLSRRGVAEAISPHSASITTKSSTRRLTYNTNRGKTGRGSASIGDTTVAWWQQQWPSRTVGRWISLPAGSLPTRSSRRASSAAAHTRLQRHLCHRHAQQDTSDPLSLASQLQGRQPPTRIHHVSLPASTSPCRWS